MKNNKIKFLLLSLIIVIIFAQISSAQIPQLKQNQSQPNQTNQPKKVKSTWETILTLFKERQKKPLTSRGICIVSPGMLEPNNIIWNNQPLFVLFFKPEELRIQGLEIRVYSPFDPKQEKQIIWRKKIDLITINSNNILEIPYTGQPLEIGKNYTWEIFDLSDKAREFPSFQIMNLEEKEQISQDLKRLETELKLQNATEEEIALEKANYFTGKQLWSDALTQMYSIKNSSPEFEQNFQQLLTDFCTPSLTDRKELIK